jgi:hypothetical protein
MVGLGIGIGIGMEWALQALRGPFIASMAARGRWLAAMAVGELCSARSPGIVGRKKHGLRGGFGGRGWGSRLRANFLARLGERAEGHWKSSRFLKIKGGFSKSKRFLKN